VLLVIPVLGSGGSLLLSFPFALGFLIEFKRAGGYGCVGLNGFHIDRGFFARMLGSLMDGERARLF